MSANSSRSPLIDIIKGAACMTIVWHHLAFYGPMSDIAQPLAPALMAFLYDYGRMAVQVFLVLGGYLAAASLAPQGVARFDQAGEAIAKRFVRLVVPYAGALLVTVIVSALVRMWIDHPSVPDAPTLTQLVANALLLQDLVGEDALSAGVWYVAVDFQLFSLSVLVWAAARALPGPWSQHQRVALARGLIAAGVAASLWFFNRDSGLDMWGVYFFGSYGLGMFAYWAVQAQRSHGWLAAVVFISAVALVLDFRGRIAVAGVTAVSLVLLLRWGRRPSAEGGATACAQGARMPAQWLAAMLSQVGQMSYSVFLVHFAVCLLVNAVVSTLWPASAAINALGMLLAFGLSLVAGRCLYLGVERHVPSWSTALRWQAGLVGTGLLMGMTSLWD